jgi:hypothetical protein
MLIEIFREVGRVYAICFQLLKPVANPPLQDIANSEISQHYEPAFMSFECA